MEIVRALRQDFQICFINGGEVIENFPIPSGIEVINIPAIKTDSEFKELQVVNSEQSLEEVKEIRCQKLLEIFDRFQPDVLMVELFPFGRRRFSFELIPLLDKAKAHKTEIVSSLRDIVVTKQDQKRHEEKVCRLMNKYFDLLLIHGDGKFIKLEESFSRIKDLNCEVYYTGYVTQKINQNSEVNIPLDIRQKPLILVSVGGGRFGHDLLESVVQTAPLLQEKLPHHIQIFTGPFIPENLFNKLQDLAQNQSNITIERYTPHLLSYMQQAELSISMSGYNTTLNILNTGVRAMMMAFTGNDDKEQMMRAKKLAQLGRVKIISPEDLPPEKFAHQIINYLQEKPTEIDFNFNGAENTAVCLSQRNSKFRIENSEISSPKVVSLV